MADDLTAIEPWLDGIMARLEPGERLKVARRIGQMLRRRNAERIRANVQPDGSAMEPRKITRDKRGRIRGRKGKMFPKTGMAKNMQVRADADQVEVSFKQSVAGAAKVHHYGLVDRVSRNAGAPRVRYPIRRLLGINDEDRELILAEVSKMLEG
jgi:phage virion morphogenesis protein